MPCMAGFLIVMFPVSEVLLDQDFKQFVVLLSLHLFCFISSFAANSRFCYLGG